MEKQDFSKFERALIDLDDGKVENIRFNDERLIFVLSNNGDRKVYDFKLEFEGEKLLNKYNSIYGYSLVDVFDEIKGYLSTYNKKNGIYARIDDNIEHNKKMRNISFGSMAAMASLAAGYIVMADELTPATICVGAATTLGVSALNFKSKKGIYEELKSFYNDSYKKIITDTLTFVAVESCDLDDENLDFIINKKYSLDKKIGRSKKKINKK